MEDFSEDKSGVSVVVRIRPPNQKELRHTEAYRCVRVQPFSNDRTLIVETSPPTPFTFDHVAGPASTQREMYERCALPIVESCLDGYNGSIFCYGQTGAGKTFTMIGPDLHTTNEYRGLIPRIMDGLFFSIEQRKLRAHFEASLQVSFLEIYNEKITDLLLESEIGMPLFNQPLVQKSLQLREDAKQGVYVEDLSHHAIHNASQGMQCLKNGLANRHVSATKMNEQSSRSHSVFTITIKSKLHEESGVVRIKTSYLHLIDLAGSERQQSTQTEGDRLAEACSINKSLSILGSVINSLVEKTKKKSRHIPYRDSKLTYLLRDSLGGNSKTCIVANISASSVQLTETISTLRFARRAKCIKNRPVINESDEGSVPALQQQILELRKQIEDMQYSGVAMESQHSQRDSNIQPTSSGSDFDDNEKQEYESRVGLLMQRIEQAEEIQDHLYNQVEQFASVIKGKDMLLNATRLSLKLKECELAKKEMREPRIGRSLLNIDYLDELDFDDSSDDEMDEDEMGEPIIRPPLSDVDKLERLMKKIWHPDRHPTVITFAMENHELRERLQKFEMGRESLEQERVGLAQRTDAYLRELQRQIVQLVRERQQKSDEEEERVVDDEQLLQLNTQVDLLTQENSELKVIIDTMNSDREQMISLPEVEAIMNQLDAIRKERDELTIERSDILTQSENLTAQITNLTTKISGLEHEKSEMEKQLNQLRLAAREFEDKHHIEMSAACQRSDILSSQVEKWKKEYELEQDTCSTLKTKVEDLAGAINQLKKEMRAMKDEEDEWRQNEALKNHEINVLTEQLSDALNLVEDMKHKFGLEERRRKSIERQVASEHNLENAIEMERAIRIKIDEQLEAVQKENERLYAVVQASQHETDSLRHELAKLQASHNEDEISMAGLNSRIQQLESQETQLTELNKILVTERDELIERVTTMKSELSKLSYMLSSKTTEFEETCNHQQTTINKLMSQVQEFESVCANHHEQESQFNIQKSSMMETIQDQSNQLQQLTGQLSQSQEANSQLDRQIEELLTHKNPKQKIHMINKIIQSNHDLKEKVKYMEQQLLTKQVHNKENEDTLASTPKNQLGRTNLSVLNVSLTSNNGSTSDEALQVARIEEVLKNVLRLYNGKRRKNDPARKTTPYCRVMEMLEVLEEEASNRGTRGSTR